MEVRNTLQSLREQIDRFEPIVCRLDVIDFNMSIDDTRAILRRVLYDDGKSIIAEIFDASRAAYGDWMDDALRRVRVASKFANRKQDEMIMNLIRGIDALNKALTRIDLLMIDDDHYDNWLLLMGDCVDMLCNAYYDIKDALDGIFDMYDEDGRKKKYTIVDRFKEHMLLA